MTTKLEAVNQMLAGIGQAPATALDQANPELSIAELTLDQVTKEVLGEGWHFNTEQNYPLMPDNSGVITVPPNVLSLSDNKQSNRQVYQTVLRDGKLYDKLNHSFIFPTGTPVSCDVVWLFDFENLPQPFQSYITQRATRLFAGRVQGAQDMVAFNSQDELILRNNCMAYDTQTSQANIFGVETGQNFYVSYAPFNTIAR
jgi:hypothetical protein